MSVATRHAQAVRDHRYLERLATSWDGEGHDCVEIDGEVFELMRPYVSNAPSPRAGLSDD
jgi:hypothetical protein